jgi:hypothetical protein
MYIEFNIEAHEFTHKHASISLALIDWGNRHNIQYKDKTIKRNIRVTFDDDRYYTLFALTWNPGFRTNYRVIRDLNNKI